LAVRPQCKSRSDGQRGNDYFQIKFSTVGGGGGLTGHPWRSDHPGTGAGGLTGPGGGQTVSTYFGHQKSISSDKIFSMISTDLNLETTQKSLRTKEKNGGAHSEFLDNILIRIMNLSKVTTIN
jgi:hypothetical protein